MDFWLAFVAGVFGSMHCVGMCGAIVLAYSTQGAGAFAIPGIAMHLTYNAGRVLSYTIVGVLFGALGQGLVVLEGVGYWFSLTAGGGMILGGIFLLRLFPLLTLSESEGALGASARFIQKLYRASFGALISVPKYESRFYLGMLTPLLPCGLLYSMFLHAAGTGSAVQGGITMFAFGMGIVPALVVTGMAGGFLKEKLRVWGDRLAAVTIIVMGIMLVLRALKVASMGITPGG